MMSYDTYSCLYDISLLLPYIYINDVFITGLAAEVCGIPRLHVEGIFPNGRPLDLLHGTELIIHHVTEDYLKEAWEIFKNSNALNQ